MTVTLESFAQDDGVSITGPTYGDVMDQLIATYNDPNSEYYSHIRENWSFVSKSKDPIKKKMDAAIKASKIYPGQWWKQIMVHMFGKGESLDGNE